MNMKFLKHDYQILKFNIFAVDFSRVVHNPQIPHLYEIHKTKEKTICTVFSFSGTRNPYLGVPRVSFGGSEIHSIGRE
jgi:hypothetical protein